MNIVITRRHTSRMSMRIVKNGDVHVSAPLQVSNSEIETFIASHREWIEQAQKLTTQQLASRQAFFDRLPLKTKDAWSDARQHLDAIVRPMLERHAAEMGVHPDYVYYQATISRWGSCHTGRKAISFSLYLLLLPEWCIEHIVVHELAHLLVPNHSPRFYAVMDRHFPRWREARAETKRLSLA